MKYLQLSSTVRKVNECVLVANLLASKMSQMLARKLMFANPNVAHVTLMTSE